MRITLGSGSGGTPFTLSSGSYYFKINGSTGRVTKNAMWEATPSPFPDSGMTQIFSGNYDDRSYAVNTNSDGGWDVPFLGSTYSTLYISGNCNLGFGSNNDNNSASDDPSSPCPCIRYGSDDSNLLQVWTTSYGSPGSRTLVYKVRGNKDYANIGVNYEYDIYFYEVDGNIDVVANQEPTDPNAYPNWRYGGGSQLAIWGVTNGTNWVDGLTIHTSSFGAPSSGGSSGGLRIKGGLRIGALLPSPSSLFMPLGTASSIAGTYPSVIWEMGNSPTSLVIPDLSGNNLTFTETSEAWNTNYYAFNGSNYANADVSSMLDGITDQMTICGWFSFPTFAGSQSLISRNNGSTGWAFRVDASGDVLNLVKYGVADQMQSLPSSMNINTWYFLAVSQNGANITYNLNGNNYTTTGSSSNFQGTGQTVEIAHDAYIGGPWATNVRELKVFGTGLSDTDLTAIYNAQKASYGY